MNTLSSSGQALSCNGGHAVGAPTQDALGCPSPGHGPCNASTACMRNLPSRERQTLEGQPASDPGRRPPTHLAPTLRRALGTQASRVCTWWGGSLGDVPPPLGKQQSPGRGSRTQEGDWGDLSLLSALPGLCDFQ